MKEYKGWQIVKMLDEKILKVGEELTVTYGGITKELVVVANVLAGALYLKEKDIDDSAPSSYFASNAVFRKKLKPLTFFEAMVKDDEGEKVTNSYVLDGIEKDDLQKGYWYKGSKGILVWHDIEGCDERYDVDLVDKELQSNWYIYEE